MARPKKDNADYFSHDADMRNDPKIKALRKKFSFKGYAIWCYLLEVLTDNDYFIISWTELNIELLSGDFDCEPEDLKNIVEYCIKLELLELNDNELYSLQLIKRFESLLSKRKRDRNRIIDSENPQSKVKKSKVKEIKEDNSKELLNSGIEIFNFLNNLDEDKIDGMIQIAQFNGDLNELKKTFSSEYIGRYGLNHNKEIVLSKFQSWMNRDKNIRKPESDHDQIKKESKKAKIYPGKVQDKVYGGLDNISNVINKEGS